MKKNNSKLSATGRFGPVPEIPKRAGLAKTWTGVVVRQQNEKLKRKVKLGESLLSDISDVQQGELEEYLSYC
jgi:hypothetical protein